MDERGGNKAFAAAKMTGLGALIGGGPTTLSQITPDLLSLGQPQHWRGRQVAVLVYDHDDDSQ